MINSAGREYVSGRCDLHLHTIVSDGEMRPEEILSCAKELHLEKISITDHDAVGAYIHFDCDFLERAKETGVSIIPGIELDSKYEGVEVHVLGYGIDINNRELNDYLSHLHSIRRERTREQIKIINRFYQKEVIREDEIFIPFRDTLMKPHLVHTLIKKGFFSGYREAAAWVSTHAEATTSVLKPYTGEIIKLVKKSGGDAFLAHPGYYVFEGGLNIDKMINELLPLGLNGLEVEYPYFGTSPKFQSREVEREIIEIFHHKARKYDLNTSRGSDAHTLDQMRRFNKIFSTE